MCKQFDLVQIVLIEILVTINRSYDFGYKTLDQEVQDQYYNFENVLYCYRE